MTTAWPATAADLVPNHPESLAARVTEGIAANA
jgi:hypothetical protein